MPGSVTKYRDLLVWRRSLDWAELVYRTTRAWPPEERFGLASQVRRAATSVASNIAEGAARRRTGEFIQFIGIARGSLAEAETQILLAQRLGYFADAIAQDLLTKADGDQPHAGRTIGRPVPAEERSAIELATRHPALVTR